MENSELLVQLQAWADTLLIWVGFGTLVGLLAKAVMPGRDPGGAVATLLMGIAGSVVGCATLAWLSDGLRVSPISPLGFAVAVAGAFTLLAFYRVLGGYFWTEEGTRRPFTLRGHHWFRRRSPRSVRDPASAVRR